MKSTAIMIWFWIIGLISIGLILAITIASGIIIIPLIIGAIFYLIYKINKET